MGTRSVQPDRLTPENAMPWIDACALVDIEEEDLVRLDHEGRTYAIYRIWDEEVYCTDGLCTHEKVHLADGLVIDHTIECPKHNGQFDVRTGIATRSPACEALGTYPARVADGRVLVEIP